jgi:hypothetical protein
MREANPVPVLTNLHTVEEVGDAIAGGSLHYEPRRVHQHQYGQR